MNKNLLKQMQAFTRLGGGFRASRVVLTANNFALFEHLKKQRTAAEVAEICGLDTRATEVLLDAVTALGLLKKTGTKYRNTATAAQFLVKDSPLYQGDMLRHSDALWKSWSGLDEVVRTGLPNRSGGRDHASFIRAMHNNAVSRARDVVAAIGLRGASTALDLGGGPGTYSLELARKGLAVTLFDLPNTVEIAQEIIADSKLQNIAIKSGDFHSDDIGSGYDLVFISQIFHSYSTDDNRALLEKACAAMNPRGMIAIQEFLLEKNRAAPVSGALFSVNMLVNTRWGRCYTPQEMKEWLVRTGFKGVKTTVLGDTVVLTAKKG